MNDVDIETPDSEESVVERAFRRCDQHEFLGQSLHPFTFSRQTTAMKLGMRFGRLSPDEMETIPNPRAEAKKQAQATATELREQLAKARKGARAEIQTALESAIAEAELYADEPDEVQTYGDIITDAVIVLWLCSQSESTVLRARRKPAEYESQIYKWADKNGIGIGGPNTAEATSTFIQIVMDVEVSTGQPVIAESSEDRSGN